MRNSILYILGFILLTGCVSTTTPPPTIINQNLNNNLVNDELTSTLQILPESPSISGKIVFQSSGEKQNIFLLDLALGQTRQLTDNDVSSEPKWSPDGGKILYVCNKEICIMDSDGDNNQQITNSDSQKWDPTWAADGQSIAYVSNEIPYAHIYILNLQNMSSHMLLSTTDGNTASPMWSPDGQWIYYTSDQKGFNIYKVKPDGIDNVKVSNGDTDDRAQLSSDGQYLVFRRIVRQSSFFNGNEIVILDTSTQKEVVLTDNSVGDDWPTFSPDGNWIVYANEVSSDLYQLLIISSKGGASAVLETGGVFGTASSWKE